MNATSKLPKGAYLVTMDERSLYTNISISQVIEKMWQRENLKIVLHKYLKNVIATTKWTLDKQTKKTFAKILIATFLTPEAATRGVLRNFAKFAGKHLCQSFFVNKVAGLRRGLHLYLVKVRLNILYLLQKKLKNYSFKCIYYPICQNRLCYRIFKNLM